MPAHGDMRGSEKGNPPRSNLRTGRYQIARRGRKSRAATKATTWPVPQGAERDDHQEQNSAYSSLFRMLTVPIAQSAERLTVDHEVPGSSPGRHPRQKTPEYPESFALNARSIVSFVSPGRNILF